MIYKVRVILDSKSSIFRDIEIKEKQTLWNFQAAIINAFNLPGEELSSFYYSDNEWTEGEAIPLEDMSDDGDGETMSDVYLNEAFPEIGAKMLFKYGLLDLEEFFCELLEITEVKSGVAYPRTGYRFGNLLLKSAKSKSRETSEEIEMPVENLEDIESDFDEQEEDEDFDQFDDIEDVDETDL